MESQARCNTDEKGRRTSMKDNVKMESTKRLGRINKRRPREDRDTADIGFPISQESRKPRLIKVGIGGANIIFKLTTCM